MQSKSTQPKQLTTARPKTTTQRTTQLLKQYKGATASGQDRENVSETSSATQRREERMKKFDIEFEANMRLEQAQSKRRKLELEMQMRELETKHQILEEERELERKIKRTVFQNDDVRSQSTGD